MGDFFLDDQFPDHPKALEAGDDACWLYVCGLAWANRHNNGVIPANAVLRLTGKPNNEDLASILCKVKLWHRRKGGYEINDWTTRNAKKISKRTQASLAAKEKWRRYYEEEAAKAAMAHADAHAYADDPHGWEQDEWDADALP